MNGLWTGRYLRRWNRNTLVARQPLTNDGPSGAVAAAPQQPLRSIAAVACPPGRHRATPGPATPAGARAMIKQGTGGGGEREREGEIEQRNIPRARARLINSRLGRERAQRTRARFPRADDATAFARERRELFSVGRERYIRARIKLFPPKTRSEEREMIERDQDSASRLNLDE